MFSVPDLAMCSPPGRECTPRKPSGGHRVEVPWALRAARGIAPSTRGATGPRYLEKLRRLARAQPTVRLIPPVEPDQIIPVSHGYDMGLFLLPPLNYNYLHALPNKFFEFVQARLGVAIGPSPEMAPYVERHALGVVAEDFAPESLARALNRLTEDEVAGFKQNSHRAARELSSAPNRRLLEELVARLLANG